MMSMKKLIVAALTCLPAWAFAQAEAAKPAAPEAPKIAWAVYGTANVNLQTTSRQGVHSRLAVSTDSSNVGIRASADVAHGLGATFQCETSAALDGIGAAGICGRNSRVGVTSPIGTIWYGNWDTPFKAAAYGTKVDDPFGNTDVFGYQSIMSSPGFKYRSGSYAAAGAGTGTSDFKGVQGFDIRAQNSVGFHSAKVQGLSLKAQYSVDEFRDNTGRIAPQLYSGVVNFDQGPVSVFASIDVHEDGMGLAAINGGTSRVLGSTAANVVTNSSSDWAWRVGAGYELASPFGATTLSAEFEQLKLSQKEAGAGELTEYKRPAWQVAGKHRIGDHELRARFSRANDGTCKVAGAGSCTTDRQGAYMVAVGYAYYLAKSTQVYLSYAQIENRARAQYTLTIGGSPNVVDVASGTDPRALGLGIRYAF